jgi:hypothetical protein
LKPTPIGDDDRVGLAVAAAIERRERTGHYAEEQLHMTPDFLRALLYEAWSEGKKQGVVEERKRAAEKPSA